MTKWWKIGILSLLAGWHREAQQAGNEPMKQSPLVTQVHRIRSGIIKRYRHLELGVQDGTIDSVQAFLEHLHFQDIAPELDAIEEEAARV